MDKYIVFNMNIINLPNDLQNKIMEKKVLTQEELQEVKNLQVENNNLISQFGELEVVIQNLSLRKEELITKLKELKDREVKIGQTLQDKYGDGNIDIETGEFVSK